MSVNISIIICTINVEIVPRALNSLVGQIKEGDELILIVDGKEYLSSNAALQIVKNNGWRAIVNEKNMGLSFCRNLGLNKMKNSFCIFFDDDTEITYSVIDKYRTHFNQGKYMVGGLLKLPKEYPPLPKWFPDGMSSLLGIHTFQYKIWGANFGFNADYAKQKNITFIQNLGRKGRGLQSGDDTTFIKQYSSMNIEALFDPDIVVYHYINKDRYKLKYMIRRAYWQGVSEVRRHSFV